MKNLSNTDKLSCPTCGRHVTARVCQTCSDLDTTANKISRDLCPVCSGKGVVLHCEACEMRDRMSRMAKSRQQRMMQHKVQRQHSYDRYYDNRFSKYR